ncbi:MAG TPA: hypothetical protein VHB02_06180 [Acidimicrobiales bacterium]|nr:hypothetical protein [Acidimicrobiales bacterium]
MPTEPVKRPDDAIAHLELQMGRPVGHTAVVLTTEARKDRAQQLWRYIAHLEAEYAGALAQIRDGEADRATIHDLRARNKELEELHEAILQRREASAAFRELVSCHDPFSVVMQNAGDVVFAASNRLENVLAALATEEGAR